MPEDLLSGKRVAAGENMGNPPHGKPYMQKCFEN